jgi:transposase
MKTMSDPKTVRSPTDAEQKTLEAMTREAVGRVAMRAQMILLSARGYSAPKIAEIQDVAKPTVYKWIDRFDEHGPEGLYDRERDGRPRKLGPDAEAELERVLQQAPTEEGQGASRWTAPRLARHLDEELGVEVHPDTVRRALRRLEYSWKRPRRVLPKPSGWKERLGQIEERVEEAGPETTVLFEDETELRRFPPLRRAWMPVGEQRPAFVPDQNGKFFLYGALDVESGEVITEAYPKGKTCYMEAFLETILAEVSGPILLIFRSSQLARLECDAGPDRSGEPAGGASSAQPHPGGQSGRRPLARTQKPDCRESGAEPRCLKGRLRTLL